MRRTIEEIITLYDLEPTTRKDIYVEGESDKELLSWYISELGQKGRAVYPISMVDVPSEVVGRLGLPAGSNRSRVIALALSVWMEISREDCTLLFVVDRDLADFVPEQQAPEGVVMTGPASMDGYLFGTASLARYLSFVCRIPDDDVESARISLFRVLRFLFALRIAYRRLDIPAKVVALDRTLSYGQGGLSVDRRELVRRSLSAANALARLDQVLAEVECVEAEIQKQSAPETFFAHGHDAFCVMGECAHLVARDSAYREERRVRSALLMGLSKGDLDSQELFKRVA